MTAPRILVVTSAGTPAAVAVPVLAALDAAGGEIRALDVGRLGARSGGTAQRVMRAIAGELSGRKLEHELDEHPPAVAVAFDPGSVAALAELRGRSRALAIAAVIAELEPDAEWGEAEADRYLALDDHAAAALDEHGVAGERIVTVGALAPAIYVTAALEDRAALRARFKITAPDPVVVVEVAGMGHEQAGQLALQLSLTAPRATYLFSAGDDVDAAAALRARVPTLAMRAKLFGATADVPLYLRAADLVVARPRTATALSALVVGARLVAYGDGGDEGRSVLAGLEARGLGTRADSAAVIGAAIESLMGARAPAGLTGRDGAGVAADAMLLMARDRELLSAERTAAAAAEEGRERPAARGPASAAGDLEDLGGEPPEEPDPRPPPRPASNASGGPGGTSTRAPRPSPSVDDLLSDLKKKSEVNRPPSSSVRSDGPRRAGVDDELEALKRKMASNKKKTP